jgi:hypothetical protein
VITSHQSEAIEYATMLAKKEQAEVIIRSRNGKNKGRNNYADAYKTYAGFLLDINKLKLKLFKPAILLPCLFLNTKHKLPANPLILQILI